MAKAPPTTEPHVERPGPAEFRDPLVRRELQKASVWFGVALAIVGVVVLGQPLLLIIGGAIFAALLGLVPKGQSPDIGTQLLGGIGRLTTAVGSVIGAVASMIAMLVIGIFLASEPRLYDRGIAWMLPLRARSGFYRIAEHVGFTL